MTEKEWFAQFDSWGEPEVHRRFYDHDFEDSDYEDAMEFAATWLRRRPLIVRQKAEEASRVQTDAASRSALAAERAAVAAEIAAQEARKANRHADRANGIAKTAALIAVAAIGLAMLELATK